MLASRPLKSLLNRLAPRGANPHAFYAVILVMLLVLAAISTMARVYRPTAPAVQTRYLEVPADRCPVPNPGEVLIITVPARDAQGYIFPGCQLVAAQGTRPAPTLAAKAGP